MKVCYGRASYLIEFVSQLEERANVASERRKQVVDLEGPLPWMGHLAKVFHYS